MHKNTHETNSSMGKAAYPKRTLVWTLTQPSHTIDATKTSEAQLHADPQAFSTAFSRLRVLITMTVISSMWVSDSSWNTSCGTWRLALQSTDPMNGWILHWFVNSAGWSFEHIDQISKCHEMLFPYPIPNHDTIKHNHNPSQNQKKRTRVLLSPRISQTLPSLLLPSALGLCRQALRCTLSFKFGCNVHLHQRTFRNRPFCIRWYCNSFFLLWQVS